MIKISALNEESSEESEEEDVPTITKEAQEQIALTEYNRALELLKKDKQEDALNIFKDLLETELLDNVEKPEVSDGRSRPMLSLKYSCFKNIAAIQAAWGNYQDAIENYWEAANLDDSDVVLWYRMGMLAMKISNLELACSSFKQGLKCNPNHWPCLDNIITAFYAVPDYMNCLLYISMALERDPNYVKGLAFRERIFKEIPCLEECYKLYNSEWELDPPLLTEYDHIMGDKLIAEAKEVAEKWAEACKDEFTLKPLPNLELRKPISKCTWVMLGESLLDMHKYIAENNLNFVSHIKLTVLKEDEKAMKTTDEDDMEDCNMDVDQPVAECETAKECIDVDKNVKIETDEINNQTLEISSDNQAFNNGPDSVMEYDVEDDKKSCSTDIQIIEDEDPIKITEADVLQLQAQVPSTNVESEEHTASGNEGNGEKEQNGNTIDEMFNTDNGIQNEKYSDKESDKSNDRVYEKTSEKASESSSKADDKSHDKTEGKDEGQKVKKRRRSALCFLQQWAWSCNSMRRSARVRSSNRREAERDDVQLEETLRRIFPSSLLPDTVKLTKDDPSKNMDDSMDTMDLYQLFANQENNSNAEGARSIDSSKSPSPETVEQSKYFGTELESAEVDAFINGYSGKSNLMIIIAKYTEFLCTKWNHEWPRRLTEIYLQAYSLTREHIPHLSPYDTDVSDHILQLDTEMTLLFGELHTDKWLDNKPDILPCPTLAKLGTGMPSEELGHIIFTSVRRDLVDDEHVLILLRVLWLKANIFLCQGDVDIVIETLELLLKRIKECESRGQNINLRLPNCKCNSHISIKVVERKLTSIQRGQKLGEIQALYDDKKYAELSLILQDTFKFAKQRHKFLVVNENIVDRVEQLAMLLDSLWQLQQYEECYVWAEACLNEAWQNYLNTSDEAEQKKWSGSVLNALEKLESCTLEVSAFVVRYLPESRLTRLVQNLVQIVCHQLDVSETTVIMPLETVLPWILLHYILQYEEDKERAKESIYKNKQHNSHQSESDDEDDGIPSSVMILFTAHQFIGRRSWCCLNDAKLLFFTMNLIIPKLDTPQFASIKNKLTKYLEQIFYCLYGHPLRVSKTRPKYLEEHHVPHMPMTWEGGMLLFDFYKPKQSPDFRSPRQVSISVDTEQLLKTIIRHVPAESDPTLIAEEMTVYIAGEKDKMPSVKKHLPYSISSIYYLLGDFYFKNNKWVVAARFYLLDLCLHPTALNSWAGLAMSTGTIIENWLNGCRLIKEDVFLTKAKVAQSSYRHAIELAPGDSVIWTEYGNFVYMVHSFCSRLLKQESDTLSMERFEVLESRKEEMLEIADQCFQSANRIFIAGLDESSKIHDERWLYQYMLGKVAEKKNLDPPIFLEHYARASEILYENNAQYPHRISHKSPQNLAIEALEVHYRIHASILKYLEQHENKPLKKSLGQLFQWHLKNCAEGPFMKYQPKLTDKRKDASSDADNKSVGKEFETSTETDKNVVTVSQRSNSIEEIEIIDRMNKRLDNNKQSEQSRIETRKRSPDDILTDNTKRIKLGSISHLQLMQDVVALIDDLISTVCDMVSEKEKLADDIMVLSSDESNEAKSHKRKADSTRTIDRSKSQAQTDEDRKNSLNASNGNTPTSNEKADNVQDLMDALMKQAMEISQETQQSSPDDEDTRKFDGKWLQNEDLQSTEKEAKDKVGDKRKSHINPTKEEVTLSRRGSQESTTTTQTTTTTTETNNTSSSSSDESSSTEDSSESDSSSDSESDSAESESEKKKKSSNFSDKEEHMTEEEVGTLIAYCLAGLEQCILRFSEHHKSFYRLSHFYFNNKTARNTAKCRDLLLGTYNCQFYVGQSFQGLFAERRASNFFSGVWHIPNHEIDRPGSFASHMSKCVTLLMQVLKETNDSRMLMQLCIQLAKTPDPDKKYLRDSEREQLSRQALTLCLQSLRSKVQSMGAPSAIDSVQLTKADPRTQVLLDVYKIYLLLQKHFPTKDPAIQTFQTLLVDTYKTYTGNKNVDGNVLEIALKCCQRQAGALKAAASNGGTVNVQPQVTSATPVPVAQPQPASTSPQTSQQYRKPHKSMSLSGRPRGRPPNVNKYLQAMQQGGNMMNQFNSKSGFASYLGTSGNHRALMNPYFMNPLIDPNILSAILTTGLGGNMMDPLSAMNYLNQMGSYQDILRQYQSNLSSLSSLTSALGNPVATAASIGGVPTMSSASPGAPASAGMSGMGNLGNLNSLTVQQILNLSSSAVPPARSAPMYNQAASKGASTTTTSYTKDRPNISITPVATSAASKIKPGGKQVAPSDSLLPMHIPKSLQISQASKPTLHAPPPPPAQVSLLKPSVLQQAKTSPPKQMAAPQIRVSKSLTEPQPAHNSPLSHSPLKTSNAAGASSSVPQLAHAPMTAGASLGMKPTMPMNVPAQRSGTSLQHKLLSKKNSQRSYAQSSAAASGNSLRKQKPAKAVSMMSAGFQGLLGSMSQQQQQQSAPPPPPPFIPAELSGISVSPVPQVGLKGPSGAGKLPGYKKSSAKSKQTPVVEAPAPLPAAYSPANAEEALSMLTQLQQQSHLEIIPQQKAQVKSSIDFSKGLVGSTIGGLSQKMTDPLRAPAADCLSLFDIPRGRPGNASAKKPDKLANDSVEIITLDD